MINQLNRKIEEMQKNIELSHQALQVCDQEIKALKDKKIEIKSYIKSVENDLETLKSALTIIGNDKNKENPFVPKKKKTSGRKTFLKNLSLKTEVIKMIKENPQKEHNHKEMAEELILKDGQSIDDITKAFNDSVLRTLKYLLDEGYVVRIDRDGEIYWKKA